MEQMDGWYGNMDKKSSTSNVVSRSDYQLRVSLSNRSISALMILFCVFFPQFSVADSRIALVVGNQSYAQAPLANPVQDATAIGGALESMGYKTTVLKDASRLELESALDDYSIAAEKSDYAVFFYAGHAIQVNGKNYLIPVDASLQKRRDINKLIGLDEVTTELSSASSLGVAIIDACRDNPFADKLSDRLGRGVVGRGLARVKIQGGKLLVAYATEADAIAEDGLGKNSPYTTALLQHISDPTLDIRLMFGRVHDDVVSATDGRQSPNIYGSLGGRRYILNANRPVSNNDIQLVNTRFQALAEAIENKDRDAIKSLTEPSQNWSRYLDYVLDNFVTIELSLEPAKPQSGGADAMVSAELTIDQLISENGDISQPSEHLRSVLLSSRRNDNDWSLINW